MARILPSGYRQLEYIEATGTQYIDTDYYLSGDNYQFKVHYDADDISTKVIFGVQPSSSLLATYNGSFYIQPSSTTPSQRIYSNVYTAGNHTLTINTSGGVVNYLFDTTSVTYNTDTNFDATIFSIKPLLLGDYWINKSLAYRNFIGKIYEFSINQNNIAVRNFIPAIKLGDNAVGMYDTVEKKFYNNEGTGVFIAGPYAKEEWESYEKKINVPILPSGYTELEYIQSSGTQYIDTGVVPTVDYTVEVKAIKNAATSIFGNSNTSVGISFTGTGTSDNYARVGSSTALRVTCTDQTIPHIWKIANRKAYCDDSVSTDTGGSADAPYTLYLFGRNGVSGFNDGGDHTVYYTKVWDANGVLIRNMIPAKNSDNVVGMYDTVTNTFFTNAGSGSFTAGPEISYRTYNCYKSIITVDTPILPTAYSQLDYIQSSGTQYIDTGIYYTTGDEIELTFAPLLTGVDKSFYGSYGNASSICELGQLSDRFRGNVGNITYAPTVVVGQKYTAKNIDGCWQIDGTSFGNTVTATISTHSNILFGRWYNGNADKLNSFKAYELIHKRDGSEILHLIPAKRNSNNRVGMYDTTWDSSQYGYIDLGTLHWSYVTQSGYTFFQTTDNFPSDFPVNGGGSYAVYCEPYNCYRHTDYGYAIPNLGFILYNTASADFIRLKDTSFGTDAVAFKSAMNGIKLYYQRTTDTSFHGPFYENSGTDSFTAGSVVNPKTTFEIYKREITA